MHVSVIICTWNNYKRLAITLDTISRCVIPRDVKWELVLVNNNCTDETSTVAQEFANKLPIVYVEEPQQGLSRAKNAGLRAASGRLLIFTDDDVNPCPGWIKTYWFAYQEKPTGFYFGGPISCEYESGKPDDELLRVAPYAITGFDWGPEPKVLAENELFLSANWACPANVMRTAGSYDIRLGLDASLGKRRVGEELDLMERLGQLGMSPWYLPRARVVHFVPRAKCTLGHIGGNAEAMGTYSVYSATTPYFLHQRPYLTPWCEKRGLTLAGIPWKLCVKTISLGARWIYARALRKKGYHDYVSLRFCVGRMKGHARGYENL